MRQGVLKLIKATQLHSYSLDNQHIIIITIGHTHVHTCTHTYMHTHSLSLLYIPVLSCRFAAVTWSHYPQKWETRVKYDTSMNEEKWLKIVKYLFPGTNAHTHTHTHTHTHACTCTCIHTHTHISLKEQILRSQLVQYTVHTVH